MIEHPPQDEMNLEHDADNVMYVPAQYYRCVWCDDEKRPGEDTTIDEISSRTVSGRCRECGQKYSLGLSTNPDHYPDLDQFTP